LQADHSVGFRQKQALADKALEPLKPFLASSRQDRVAVVGFEEQPGVAEKISRAEQEGQDGQTAGDDDVHLGGGPFPPEKDLEISVKFAPACSRAAATHLQRPNGPTGVGFQSEEAPDDISGRRGTGRFLDHQLGFDADAGQGFGVICDEVGAGRGGGPVGRVEVKDFHLEARRLIRAHGESGLSMR